MPTHSETVRFELLRQWLACDDAAGDRLWSDREFYDEARPVAHGVARRFLGQLRETGFETVTGEPDVETFGDTVLHDVLMDAKRLRGPDDFENLEMFQRYRNRSVARRVLDTFRPSAGHAPIRIDHPIPGTERSWEQVLEDVKARILDDLDHEAVICPIVIAAVEAFPKYLNSENVEKSRRGAADKHYGRLLSFHGWTTAGAFRCHTAADICGYLEQPGARDDDFVAFCVATGLSANTARARTSELRKYWRAFREETPEGRALDEVKPQAIATPVVAAPPSRTGEFSDVPWTSLADVAADVIAHFRALRERGGGLLAIGHTVAQEYGADLVLARVYTALRQQEPTVPVQFYRPLSDYDPSRPELANGHLVVPGLARMEQVLAFLQREADRGRVILATGLWEEWGSLRVRLDYQLLRLFPDADGGASEVREIESAAAERLAALDVLAREICTCVALLDSWSLPAPLGLIAAWAGEDREVVFDRARELVEDGVLTGEYGAAPRPGYSFRTHSPAVARHMLVDLLGPNGLGPAYARLLQRANPSSATQRYALLRLVESVLARPRWWERARATWALDHGRHIFVRSLLHAVADALAEVWQHVSAVEAVLWSGVLRRLGLFSQGEAALVTSLEREPENVRLLHARAVLRAEHARSDPSVLEQARQAFREVERHAVTSPHLYQAWALLEADLGQVGVARDKLLQARERAFYASEKAHVEVAWADLEVELGNGLAAARHLKRAFDAQPGNDYALHVEAKSLFLRGEYEPAQDRFNAILRNTSDNIYALHAQGHMARVRGHWSRAQQLLGRALELDDERVETLTELGVLATNAGRAAVGGEGIAGLPELSEAVSLLDRAARLEPGNPRVIVSRAVAYTDLGRLEEAAAELEALLDRRPSLHAQHALARVRRRVGKRAASDGDAPARDRAYAGAESELRAILDAAPGNLAALLELADVFGELGRVDEALGVAEVARRRIQVFGDAERARRAASEAPGQEDAEDAEDGGNESSYGEFLPIHELVRATNKLAVVESRLGKFEKAVQTAREALEWDANNAFTLHTLARLLDEFARNGGGGALATEAAEHREIALMLAAGPAPANKGSVQAG